MGEFEELMIRGRLVCGVTAVIRCVARMLARFPRSYLVQAVLVTCQLSLPIYLAFSLDNVSSLLSLPLLDCGPTCFSPL